MAHLLTPEGIDQSERIHEFVEQWKAQRQESLTEREKAALDFIRAELGRGHSPSVREITKAVGVRSLRTGHKIVQVLLLRGLVRRDDNNLLTLP